MDLLASGGAITLIVGPDVVNGGSAGKLSLVEALLGIKLGVVSEANEADGTRGIFDGKLDGKLKFGTELEVKLREPVAVVGSKEEGNSGRFEEPDCRVGLKPG